MPSLVDLLACAEEHVRHYLDPASARAFAAYDVQGDPHVLLPADILAPALLDAPVRGREVIAMQQPEGNYRVLWNALQAVLTHTDPDGDPFEEQDLSAQSGAWSLVCAALVASDSAPGLKASKVTKILHRKRPGLVPIFDSRVTAFYGVSVRTPWHLWPLLKQDVLAHRPWLESLGAGHRTPDGRAVSVLRVLDMAVWEHSWGCTRAAR